MAPLNTDAGSRTSMCPVTGWVVVPDGGGVASDLGWCAGRHHPMATADADRGGVNRAFDTRTSVRLIESDNDRARVHESGVMQCRHTSRIGMDRFAYAIMVASVELQ